MRTGSRAARTPALTLALCCTVALTGCGGPARDGYAAVGAAAPGPERGAGENVPPRGQVEYQPAGPSASPSAFTTPGAPESRPGGSSARGGATPTTRPGSDPAPGTPPAPGPPPPAAGTGGAGNGDGRGDGDGDGPGTPAPGSGGTGSSGGTGGSGDTGGTGGAGGSGGAGTPGGAGGTPPPPVTPAALTLSTPARAAASDRWCEHVTVTFTNTGTTPARSGTVGFATHIIGALGIDWATITTTQPLPAPVAGRSSRTQTYTVCVDAWRVPLGMHVETRKVTATWN
ncbi:hypothetical protein ABZW02_24380 [Streptomyces sp. NPDC005180]|uniref:hypothetical protein n=1 Tax=Streptomyces sp. NPDC005180 TaxID=3156868 RepID=UPI0033A34091